MKKNNVSHTFGGLSTKLNAIFLWRGFVPLVVLALGGMLLAVSIYFGKQIPKLNTSYSIKDFFPKQHALLETDNRIKHTFALTESPTLYFIIKKTGKNHWLSEASYQEIKKVTQSIQSHPNVKSVLSISNLEGAQITPDGISVGPILDDKSAWSRIKIADQNPILKPSLLSSDGLLTAIAIEPSLYEPARIQQFSEMFRTYLQKNISSSEVFVAGVPAIQFRLSEVIQSDLSKFLLIVVAVFCTMFYFLFQSFGILLFALGALVLVNLTVLGIIAYFQIPFNVILSTLPILISISAMSLLVHTLHLWAQVEKPTDLNNRFFLSLKKLRELFLANFLGSLTTTIGFVALMSSSIPVIQKYGYVVGASVLLTWLLIQIYIAAGLVWLNPRMKSISADRSHWSLWGMKHATPILLGVLLTVFISVTYIPNIKFSSKLFDDLPSHDPIRQATEIVDRNFGGVVNYEVTLVANAKDFWKNSKTLSSLEELSSRIKTHQGVGSTLGLYDFLPKETSKTSAQIAETLFLFSLSNENPIRHFLTEDGRQTRLSVRLKDIPTEDVQSVRAMTRVWVQKLFGKNVTMHESGLAISSHLINKEVAKNLVFGFWESLVLIGVFLVFLFGSLRWALIACLPNLIPPILLMGVLGFLQTDIKPGIALIFSIVLGLAFNNTVYLLARLKKIIPENVSFQKSLKKSLLQEGSPCAFETLIMLSGFSIFMFSSFGINKLFGGFMVLTIIFGFVADLLFLPALLSLFPEIGEKSMNQKLPKKSLRLARLTPVLIAMFLLYGERSQALTVNQILAASAKSLSSKDDQAEVQMDIIEANNDIKVRKFKMKTSNTDGFKALIRMQEPSDIKNTGFLAKVKEDDEQQWIYLPSSKQVRRVVSQKSGSGILGSEISSQDLSAGMVKSSKVSLWGSDKQYHILNVQFKRGHPEYTHAYSYLDKNTYVPMRTVYFKGKQKIKTVEFLGYKFIDKKVWRAQEIRVVNHLNSRRTNLKFKTYKVNAGLRESDFSQSALKGDS